jgi:hypothetical protein
MPRESTEEVFEREVEETVNNFEALAEVKLHPHVSPDGRQFTITASEDDFEGGVAEFLVRNSAWNELLKNLREGSESDVGRAVLIVAYERFLERIREGGLHA